MGAYRHADGKPWVLPSVRKVNPCYFTVQPKYRKKEGVTQDERNRNFRRLKMFDRAQTTSNPSQGRVKPEYTADKRYIAESTTQGGLTGSSGDASASDPLPPYFESRDDVPDPPPTYDVAQQEQRSACGARTNSDQSHALQYSKSWCSTADTAL